jgi:hypothetical protein
VSVTHLHAKSLESLVDATGINTQVRADGRERASGLIHARGLLDDLRCKVDPAAPKNNTLALETLSDGSFVNAVLARNDLCAL